VFFFRNGKFTGATADLNEEIDYYPVSHLYHKEDSISFHFPTKYSMFFPENETVVPNILPLYNDKNLFNLESNTNKIEIFNNYKTCFKKIDSELTLDESQVYSNISFEFDIYFEIVLLELPNLDSLIVGNLLIKMKGFILKSKFI
jgi:hypothetical protein